MMLSPRGVGDVQTTQQINSGVATAGAITAGAAQAGLLSGIGIATTAVPVIGLVTAGVIALLSAFKVGQGCGATCTAATDVVNKVIPMMQDNLRAAQMAVAQNGGCLSVEQQQTALANFDALWNAIVQACTQIGGQGGKGCIDDRKRGGKYDCFVTLRDPISAMEVCDVAAAPAGDAGNGLVGALTSGGSGMPLLLGAAALVAVAVMGGRK
jgi:hypothetical protein